MKKTLLLTVIVFGFFSTWLIPSLILARPDKISNDYIKFVEASSSTIWVPDSYTTIQEAIDKANEGDTIFVRATTYYEHVIVDKALSLVGENKDDTIIDGEGTGTVVEIRANNVTLRNFTIQNADVGIWLWYSHGSNLTGNIVSNNRQYGIFFGGYSDGNIISDNTISHNSQYGVYFSSSTNSIFTNNTISNNDNGIYIWSSSNNIFAGNNFSENNDNGIYIWSSSNNIFAGNNFSENINGIHLFHSSENVVSGNIVLNNNYGIYVGDSDKNVILNSKASNNQRGIYLHFSRENILNNNTLDSNLYGILLDSSSNNEILHNNFINNVASSRSINSVSSWDNGVEGNYWSDYQGSDANRDGIGNTPYNIEENNEDNYPLMAMHLQFSVLMENKTYLIDAVSDSTISDFQFHSNMGDRTKAVSFNVNGEGFCRISIPHSLVSPPFTVKVDDSPPLYFKKVYANRTHTWIYFTYDPSEHEVTIMQTFPSEQLLLFQWATLGLTIIAVVLFSITVNYYRLFIKQKKVIEAYESEVGSFPVSHEERARIRFVKDVIEREKKLEKFKKKYGVKFQPASTLEDLTEKLGVKKES